MEPPPPPEEEKEEVVEPVEAVEEEDRLSSRSYAKEIVAGEERPKVNSGQQTTPTDGKFFLPPLLCNIHR